MKKVTKKVMTLVAATGLGISMSFSGMNVQAAQSTEDVVEYKQDTESKEWNQTEIKALQFDSTDQYEKYLANGGTYQYNKNFNEKDRMIKITVEKAGYFALATESED